MPCTRPAICRNFMGYRMMLVYHGASGEIRGRAIGSREIRSDDAMLNGIWKNEIGEPAPDSCNAPRGFTHLLR